MLNSFYGILIRMNCADPKQQHLPPFDAARDALDKRLARSRG